MEADDTQQALPPASSAGAHTQRQKQLLFDKRYGWVYEKWTDPVEIANTGGRGMFSLIPLTAATLDATCHLADRASDCLVHALRNREKTLLQLEKMWNACGDMATERFRILGKQKADVGQFGSYKS